MGGVPEKKKKKPERKKKKNFLKPRIPKRGIFLGVPGFSPPKKKQKKN